MFFINYFEKNILLSAILFFYCKGAFTDFDIVSCIFNDMINTIIPPIEYQPKALQSAYVPIDNVVGNIIS
jgi:hypothetical protein